MQGPARGAQRARSEETFDLVLLDPPYAFDHWDALLPALEALAPEGLVVIESDRPVDLPDGWRVEREKRYGGTLVLIVRPASSPPEPP